MSALSLFAGCRYLEVFRFLSLIPVTKERSPELRSYGHDGGVLLDRVFSKAWPSHCHVC